MRECWVGACGAKRDLVEGASECLVALAYSSKFKVLRLRETSQRSPPPWRLGGIVLGYGTWYRSAVIHRVIGCSRTPNLWAFPSVDGDRNMGVVPTGSVIEGVEGGEGRYQTITQLLPDSALR